MDELDLGATIRGFSAGQKIFNRYELKKLLGRGGMGVVWLARDEELGRETALKFLPEVVATDRAAIDDLKREVRRAINLAHPHIVKIHDFVSDGRTAGISMEYVDGDTLSSLRIDEPSRVLTVDRLAPWVTQLCAALGYAHAKAKVVHRDLKPANLMIDREGDLKVLDFGIAASLSDSVSRVSKQAGSSGTPLYMSPQQMMGVDPAVTDDIYALGATLYELLTGKPPFHSGSILEQVRLKVPALVNERRQASEVAGEPVPAAWEETIAACLAKEPKDRPQSAGEVAERLGLAAKANAERSTSNAQRSSAEKVEPGLRTGSERVPKPRTTLYAALVTGILVLAAAGWYFGSYAPEQARKTEIARLESEQRTEEANRLRTEKGKAAAAVKARMEQERLAAEAKQKADEAERARLAAARGGIVVRTNPAGAEVRVGAIALEKSPLTLKDQKLGSYPVRVRLDGYEEWTGAVEVKENEFADLDVTLVRSMGRVVLTGTAGAEVSDGTRRLGNLPLSLDKIATGVVRYAISLKGYKATEVSGDVPRNSELRLTAELEKQRRPEVGQVWTIPDLALVMQPIAPGTFQMGSTSGEADEQPVTRVTLTQAYWLGKTEVTQAQWTALMGNNPSGFKGDSLPVEQVSWDEAMEYCRKLTARERAADQLPAGYIYTLPTEAQWEYACRSGTTGDYAGNLDSMGWYTSNSGSTTHPVGQKQANAWGLADMHGNVWEWCSDWYGNYPGGSVTDPTGASSGSFRVCRGGGWGGAASGCRSAVRFGCGPGLRYAFLGFRLALSSVP